MLLAKLTLTVFAAASLREAFTKLSAAFEASHPQVKVAFSFAGSQELRLQLEHGARAFVALLRDVKRFDVAQLVPGRRG